ncbi:MAG: DedA family protein [Alphaproteobacteria bacterium]|nr:DedA family protein [Alphaproteobacteria bacterium]
MNTILEYGLLAVLVALLLTAVGLPIPEDISLIAAGVLAANGHANYVDAVLVGYVGVLGSDLIAFGLGRRVGLHPKGWLGRMFGERQIRRIMRFYRRFGPWTVVICRNLPGMRFPAFFFSGATGMSLRRFLALDAAAAVVTVAVWTQVGWWLGPRVQQWFGVLSDIRYALMGLGLTLAAVVMWRVLRPGADPEEGEGALNSSDPQAGQ